MNISANRIHMTKDTKELLDQTGRFLIEKRGTMHIKVGDFDELKILIYFYRVKVI